MDVLITGAAGFVGRELVDQMLGGVTLHDAAGRPFRPTRLVLTDRRLSVPGSGALGAPGDAASAAGVEVLLREGDLGEPGFIASLIGPDTACVFHLAGIVSGAAEADFDAGLRVNLDATRALLDAIRVDQPGRRPVRIVHTSSIAVYGQPIPARIDDRTQPWPTLSYGAQKLACELLIGDMSRRGLVDGRSVRLSGVLVRPPVANGALSGFNSDLIREPLHGRPVVSPVTPAATIWIQSSECTVSNLVHAMTLDAALLGPHRALLLPAVAASIAEIVEVIGEVAGTAAKALVSYRPDPALEPMFGRWPKPFTATRALDLGFRKDADAGEIVSRYARRIAQRNSSVGSQVDSAGKAISTPSRTMSAMTNGVTPQ